MLILLFQKEKERKKRGEKQGTSKKSGEEAVLRVFDHIALATGT